ncbi:MAG: AAA family ATPase, partial [Candidatus Eremiobacteraeota bacterium]|nr:AAA family ATPase [Candidatus Eremiobacteraeota bacterium]
MLRRLEIERFGLIGNATIEFASGATIFTGETGSGKTMLVGALEFALGARAAGDSVAPGGARTTVTLTFDPDDDLRLRLNADGYELDPNEDATIVREMNEGGRTAIRINGKPSTAAYVRSIGATLAEIVGQHEAQRLLSPAYHLEQLDRFAGEQALRLRAAVARAHARVAEGEETLERLTRDDEGTRRRYEDAVFAVNEIEAARLEGGEDERLEQRRRYLDNVERIAQALRAAHEALAADDAGAISELGNAAAAIGGVAAISTDLRALSDRSAALQSEAIDVAAGVAAALEATEFNPAELEQIHARLAAIDALKRKYGGSVTAALAFAERARTEAAEYEGRDRRIAGLDAQLAAARVELQAAAEQLSAVRAKAAAQLSKRVAGEFGEIALGSGRFEIAL